MQMNFEFLKTQRAVSPAEFETMMRKLELLEREARCWRFSLKYNFQYIPETQEWTVTDRTSYSDVLAKGKDLTIQIAINKAINQLNFQ
jgi:hypothetical protein